MTGTEPSPELDGGWTDAIEYDDWYLNDNYLQGLCSGRFHQDARIRELVDATPAVDDIRYRGERLTVHPSPGGAIAVLNEEWFSRDASTWVAFPTVAMARAWTHGLAARWLRSHLPQPPQYGGSLDSWGGRCWAAERDLLHGRWAVVIGPEPAPWYHSLETEDPAAGWDFVAHALADAGVHLEHWPAAMRSAHATDTGLRDDEAPVDPPTAPALQPPANDARPRPAGRWAAWWRVVNRLFRPIGRTTVTKDTP
ncbi:hypothetical protein [Streptomyces sp. XH2]|uniref:hypothetical protein n=1 Tax=Streptomyces sp. XH2 TaxID=3412483 RepID=UPI003C7BADDD